MIQPIKLHSSYNMTFKGDDAQKPQQEAVEAQPQQAPIEEAVGVYPDKPQVSGFKRAKLGVMNVLKGVNNVTNTTHGALSGIAKGAVAAGIVGVVGKSIKKADGNIAGTLKNIGSDIFTAAKETVCFFPKLLTKPLLEDAKNVLTLAPKFYTKYLKDNKATAAIATIAGLGVFAYNTIGGKIRANVRNADLDHKFRHGHIK